MPLPKAEDLEQLEDIGESVTTTHAIEAFWTHSG